MSTLVGGVGQLFQGDLDLGRLVVERLAEAPLGPNVLVEELHYGAVAVVQRLDELRPTALVLVGAIARGRPPGTVERRRVQPRVLAADQVQEAVTNAVTGYVTIDLVVDVATGFGALPARTVAIEVEPANVDPGEGLSALAEAGLDEVVNMVRDEVRRVPLLDLSDQLRHRVRDEHPAEAPAAGTLRALLDGLRLLDETGHWGGTFALRDRLRRQIAHGHTSDDMEHVDWGLWWALIEELDRLQGLEAVR